MNSTGEIAIFEREVSLRLLKTPKKKQEKVLRQWRVELKPFLYPMSKGHVGCGEDRPRALVSTGAVFGVFTFMETTFNFDQQYHLYKEVNPTKIFSH